jgi:gluconate 2-dehydrogenase gamma chain
MIGFFTSEAGATRVLRHEHVPGFYDGCVPFEEIGRTWATG